MGNHHDNIKNEIAYFHKVIKNMDLKESIKSSKINEHEIPIEEVIYDEFQIHLMWTSSCFKQVCLAGLNLLRMKIYIKH